LLAEVSERPHQFPCHAYELHGLPTIVCIHTTVLCYLSSVNRLSYRVAVPPTQVDAEERHADQEEDGENEQRCVWPTGLCCSKLSSSASQTQYRLCKSIVYAYKSVLHMEFTYTRYYKHRDDENQLGV
jgi:hypothetical protein